MQRTGRLNPYLVDLLRCLHVRVPIGLRRAAGGSLPALVLAASCASASDATDLMRGKVDTGRTILFEATLNASPQSVFALWTKEEGITRFFASKAVVEPRLGGRYEMIFLPEADPEGASHGTKGARILRFEPGHALSFEWYTFVSRDLTERMPPCASNPPMVSEAERNAEPIATWVDLVFAPSPNEPHRTHLRLAHRGFRTGPEWDAAFAYFWKGWAGVLGRLGALCSGPGGCPTTRATDQVP